MAINFQKIQLRRAANIPLLCLALTALAVGPAQSQTPTEVVLHSFAIWPHGAFPKHGVILGPAGNLFGTTPYGGAANRGVLFKLDPAGHETVLHSFSGGGPNGIVPNGVIGDSAGNLYGTTVAGGAASVGEVYRLNATGGYTVLHNFTRADGAFPNDVIADSAGNLYGTTDAGGLYDKGVIFELDTAGNFKVLYNFTGGAGGGGPLAGVMRGPAGNLYGTTYSGGTANAGVVYKLHPGGKFTVLYNFTGGADGGSPTAGVIRDPAGNLYGTTPYDGAAGYGVVYKLDATGNYTVLHNFTFGADGGLPFAGLIRDPAGNFYGTTQFGGTASYGVVFKLDPAGILSVLYSFTGGADGGYPYNAGVIRDSAGNLYGTTTGRGPRQGAVYKLDATGRVTVLYTFLSAANGTTPNALTGDSAGNLYGTTYEGGSTDSGVVFQLDATGHETVLYKFNYGADGRLPSPTSLFRDAAGNLYGTTLRDGTEGAGVLFKLDLMGNYTVLHIFSRADGSTPSTAVVADPVGNLYGTAQYGGSGTCGVAYKLDPAGKYTVLHSFTCGADGGQPAGDVVFDPAGNLYGSTVRGGPQGYGVLYKLDPAGNESTLYSFTGGSDGRGPNGVIRDSAGNLYGTARQGGTAQVGVVFKLDQVGNFTVLHNFILVSDGGSPESGLIRDPSGNLYGTAPSGGSDGCGVVYKLDPERNFTVLHAFTCGADGANPKAGLIRGPAGDLFGTTSTGGKKAGGVVFMLQGAAP